MFFALPVSQSGMAVEIRLRLDPLGSQGAKICWADEMTGSLDSRKWHHLMIHCITLDYWYSTDIFWVFEVQWYLLKMTSVHQYLQKIQKINRPVWLEIACECSVEIILRRRKRRWTLTLQYELDTDHLKTVFIRNRQTRLAKSNEETLVFICWVFDYHDVCLH